MSEVRTLIEDVKQWGRDRHIDNPYRQLNKVMEELGELSHEVCRDRFDTPEFSDSIGDVLVTIILLADMTGHDPVACLEQAYKEISKRSGVTSDGMFIKEEKNG